MKHRPVVDVLVRQNLRVKFRLFQEVFPKWDLLSGFCDFLLFFRFLQVVFKCQITCFPMIKKFCNHEVFSLPRRLSVRAFSTLSHCLSPLSEPFLDFPFVSCEISSRSNKLRLGSFASRRGFVWREWTACPLAETRASNLSNAWVQLPPEKDLILQYSSNCLIQL